MEGLFNPTSILLHVFNAAILFVALYFLLYKPVRKFLKAREDKINAGLDAVRDAEKNRDALLSQGHAALAEAQEQAMENTARSVKAAEVRAQTIIENANAEARKIVNRAHTEAQHIVATTRSTMVEEAAVLAVEMAQAILSREISDEDQNRLIEEFLKKVD